MSTASASRENLFSTIVKAAGGDGELASSNLLAREEEFASAMGALPCPYPPEPLVRLYERSSALRPCVEAMTTNVHAFGHRLVPTVDFAAPDVDKRIADILLAERLHQGDDDPPDPTEAEIAARKAEIERGMRVEGIRLAMFFKNCATDGFIALRKRIGTDMEVTGNAYMEVVRDAAGRIARLNYCPAVNMRLRPLEKEPAKVVRREWVSDVTFESVEEREYLRGFIQRVNARTVYFKAFGDTRIMGANDGRFYETAEEMPKGERAATEVVHFWVDSQRTSYGVPRWIGAVFEVLGIEAYSQVNYLTFDNKGIPPLAISVSGGSLTDDSVRFLEDYWKAKIKGRLNYHAILLLEAVPAGDGAAGSSVQTRIAIQPLAQPQDAVFLQYADRSEDITARQWRISPITRGKTKDYNKATSEAALKKDEEQVFQPERVSFDERFERTVLRDLGVRYHRVESNSPIASDPEALAKILDILMNRCLLTPNEGRHVVNNILNEDFQDISADWANQPIALTLANIPLQDGEPDEQVKQKAADAATTLQRVMQLRDMAREAAQSSAGDAEKAARRADADIVEERDEVIDGQDVHLVRLTQNAMNKLVRARELPELAAAA